LNGSPVPTSNTFENQTTTDSTTLNTPTTDTTAIDPTPSLEDALKTVQDRLLTLETSNQTLLDFYTNLNLGVIPVVISGRLDLGDIVVTVKDLHAKGSVEAQTGDVHDLTVGTFSVENENKDAKMIGTATLLAGETSVDIKTEAVGETSRIFVTPEDDPVSFAVSKDMGTGFSIRIHDALLVDSKFSWWIVEDVPSQTNPKGDK
ncbi:MAG: hypothetical protein WAU31_00040, partial [Candidatus Moraniibacteriota bacterium]